MSQTLERESVRRLAPIPQMEPPASTYCSAQEEEACAMQDALEKYNDAVKALHARGIELLQSNQFAKELPAFEDNVKVLADIMVDITKTDIPYLWDFMS
ncbi:hypothetical protein [Acetobacter senegalensis]|uniref:hypothetical protein n=1 Tax=Acetobacter senegalensis TaxID=446692 RepID=UPI00264AD043|nr:hypothetical protein [Acetobacter senegalensis]MDN7356353.1 hypothetical protein [Acetobacter senegalensis]